MLTAGMLLVGVGSVRAQCVFSWDFERNADLSSWNYFNDSPACDQFTFGNVAGERCLKTQGLYGFSHRFDKPVAVDAKVKKVILTATVLLPSKPVHIVPLAVSTRPAVVPNTSWPFDGVSDSGLLLKGCIFDSPRHQQLAFFHDGKESVHTTGSVSPRNIGKADAWETWTLVYDNVAKTAFAFTTLEPDRPRLKLYNVDLSGKVLQSVFLPAQGVCHRNVRVFVE